MDRREVRLLMQRLERDARHIAGRFELRYRALEPERRGVRTRYGLCTSDGLIKIRLRHASTGRPLRYSSLINTLCHELAHLRHFDHGPRFRAFYLRLLEYARAEGIYRPRAPAPAEGIYRPRAPAPAETRAPRPRTAPGPVQLDLFA